MITPMIPDNSGVHVNGVSRDAVDSSVLDGRRRSWGNRGRSQVIFNGPPLGNSTEHRGRSDQRPPQRCVERQTSRDVAVQPA